GHVPHDGEPGTAVGAVEERVPVPAVTGVEQLRQALLARGGVGGDRCPSRTTVVTVDDAEPDAPPRWPRHDGDAFDVRPAEGVDLPGLQESGHARAPALNLDDHTTGVVADPPVQSEPLRQAVHERAEPDTLHHALDPELNTPDRADDALTRLHGTGGRPP